MKKILLLLFFLTFPFFVSAYNKDDIIDLVKNQQLCDSETENIYQKYFNTYSRIVDAKDINETLANQIYDNLTKILKIVKDNNICSINDLDNTSSEIKSLIYNTLYNSSKLIFSAPNLPQKNTNITYNSDSTIDIYEDGKLVDKIELNLKKFNYVGVPKIVIFIKYIIILLIVFSLFLSLIFNKKNIKKFNNTLTILISLNSILLIIYYTCGSTIYDMYSLIKTMNIDNSVEVFEIKEKNHILLNKPTYGSAYGTLKIDNLNIEVPVLYGDSKDVLKKGIGHTNSTSLPGEGKVIIYSGHNSKNILNSLKDIKENELIVIETSYGKFEYQVFKIEILKDSDYNKLLKETKEMLILYTCYPFDELIYNESRLVVYANLIESRWFND